VKQGKFPWLSIAQHACKWCDGTIGEAAHVPLHDSDTEAWWLKERLRLIGQPAVHGILGERLFRSWL
jgi:hypothetical protein